MDIDHAPRLWKYIRRNLDDRGLTTGDLARATGVHRSRLTEWRQGRSMSVPTARSIARLFDTSIVEVLVVAGLLFDDEVHLQRARPDSSLLTDAELMAELKRRLDGTRSALDPVTATEADLTEADLTGADLTGAGLEEAELTESGLEEAGLEAELDAGLTGGWRDEMGTGSERVR
ncbi:helix-turn-helix domain-containing protein [Actinosynnema sp. NPDC050436]|uniref:helix-turn-helix domain-containing protein n=1 Tax=Actinosynnema sp. NPDC050436 TaxID=3155659 RepID=UPI0034075E17